MTITNAQRHGITVAITAHNLTAEQIREAADRWPEWITSERSGNALGLPERHTAGGLPIYPPSVEMHHAREDIASIINAHWNDASDEHTLTVAV